MICLRRKRWLTLLIGLGAIALGVVAAGLVFVEGQGSSAPTERLQNTTAIQEAIFLTASYDYADRIGERPVLVFFTHEVKKLDGYDVWVATESKPMLKEACTGAKSIGDVYLVEATIRLEKKNTTIWYRNEVKGETVFWKLYIDQLKHCQLATGL